MKTGLCNCYRAWTDVDCSVPRCGFHGTMLPDGSCKPDSGWFSPIPGGKCHRVGDMCMPTIRCVADRSDFDTCNAHATGCSMSGACMCEPSWTGAVCHIRLETDGEQIRKSSMLGTSKDFMRDLSPHKDMSSIYEKDRFLGGNYRHLIQFHEPMPGNSLSFLKSAFVAYAWATWIPKKKTML